MRDVFRQLDLNLLRVFAALMAEGNVTRAAARLALSQSAVSNALNRLRQSLDDALFEKTASGVRPTARAIELWSQIQPHFEAMRQVISPDRFDPRKFGGKLTIAMSDYGAERILPRLMDYMDTHAPSLRIDLTPYSLANLPSMFDRGGVDLAIGGYLNDAGPSSGIRTQELWPVHWSCLMRRDHPLAKGPLTMARLMQARHLDVIVAGMQVPLYDSLLAAHALKRNIVLTLNSYAPALAIIAESNCIGVFPTSLLDLTRYERVITSRKPPINIPVRPFCVIWHQRWEAHAAHRWLRETIASLFAQPVA